MSYSLEAYLAPVASLEGEQPHRIPEVFYRLTDDIALIPLTRDASLPESWAERASAQTTIARVSADYFGGYGGQTATVWERGRIVADDVDVNEALRRLGVEKAGGDEWDTVGLGRFRRTQTWAAEAIRQRRGGAAASLDELLQALRHESSDPKLQEKVRSGAAHDLGELGDVAALPHLVRAVEGREYGLKIAAAAALARLGDAGLDELAGVLRRAEREPTAVERIVRLFRSPEPFDYFPVVHALGEAGERAGPCAPDLVRLLRHVDYRTRREAAQALGKIGPAASRAVPQLIELLEDEEPTVRRAAEVALASIDVSSD